MHMNHNVLEGLKNAGYPINIVTMSSGFNASGVVLQEPKLDEMMNWMGANFVTITRLANGKYKCAGITALVPGVQIAGLPVDFTDTVVFDAMAKLWAKAIKGIVI